MAFSRSGARPPDESDNQKEADKLRSVSVFKTMTTQHKMRLLSQAALDKALPWHPEPGAYHCITSGDVDALSYLRHVVKSQRVEYALISTWCMAKADAEEVLSWVERGDLGRVDFYVGEIFKDGYRGCLDVLYRVCERCGGRVARFRNHSKVMAVYGADYDCVIETSANVDTNPRTEQAVMTVGDTGLCDFFKGYYDGIRDFDGRYRDWQPWERGR